MTKQYFYDGPVLRFNTIIANRWRASTYAVSEKEAMRNLVFRFKKENGLEKTAKVSFVGSVHYYQA